MPSENDRDDPTSLQRIILGLTRFWTRQGCLLIPACDFELPAGSLHPENFFRMLGTEPWRVTYVQPIRSPADGRRRDHPFRFLKHLQFQVVLKPPPPDVREPYLRSLEEVGLELAIHDLRFAEWSWESPAIDAWGAGWHALIDGLGMTRLTFIRQVAGRDLEPVAVELSYGLERLAMLLGDLPSAHTVPWDAGGPTYWDLRGREEAELSRYVFEVADPEPVRRQLEAAIEEAERCQAAGLARTAYELSLKAFAGVEMLAARGDLGGPEREEWLAKVRVQAAAAATLHLESAGAAAAVSADPPQVIQEAATETPAPVGPARKRRSRKRRQESRDGG